jgi:hypothetical protein
MVKPGLLIHRGRQLVQHVVPAVIKPLRALWNEIISFLFFILAIPFLFKGYQILHRFDGSVGAFLSVGMCAFLTLLMTYYGISSYLRARKISRS